MPDSVAARIKHQREDYKNRNGGNQRQNSQLDTNDNHSTVSTITTDQNGVQYVQVPVQHYVQQTQALYHGNSTIGQTSTQGKSSSDSSNQNFMGGRNAQADLRSRNTNNNK